MSKLFLSSPEKKVCYMLIICARYMIYNSLKEIFSPRAKKNITFRTLYDAATSVDAVTSQSLLTSFENVISAYNRI